MKKIIRYILLVAIVLSFSSCGSISSTDAFNSAVEGWNAGVRAAQSSTNPYNGSVEGWNAGARAAQHNNYR